MDKVKPIVLSGDDAIQFIKNMYVEVRESANPAADEIAIEEDEGGFTAIIPSLDLSFLKEEDDDNRTKDMDV
jgi:hypothetical protein